MSYKIENSNEFGRLTEKRLTQFEKAIGQALPADYRAYLLEHNGGSPEPNCFSINGPKEGSLINTMFGIHSGPDYLQLTKNFKIFQNRIPPNLLAIGDDPGGNLVCISLAGEDQGAIYFWDHELESEEGVPPTYDNLSLISKSFLEFLDGLFEIPPDFEDELEKACQTGDTKLLQKLLEAGGDVHHKYEHGRSLLQIGSIYGKLEIAKILVEHGANIGGVWWTPKSRHKKGHG